MLKSLLSQVIIFSLSFVALFIFSQNVSFASCKDAYPPIAPVLISAVAGNESVTLTWTQEPEQFTNYLVAYGRDENSIEYGNPNIGGSDLRTYTVDNLTNGVKYYFRVKPINGCKPGKFSNKLSAVAGGYQKTVGVPNLSLYKTVDTTTATPTQKIAQKGAKPKVLGAAIQKVIQPVTFTWQLLAIEALLLILYFSLTLRTQSLSLALSVFIPIATFIAFLTLNKTCSATFFCKYFIQLDIVIFVVIVAISKLFIWKKTPLPKEDTR